MFSYIWNIPLHEAPCCAFLCISYNGPNLERAIAAVLEAAQIPGNTHFRRNLEDIRWQGDLETVLRRRSPQITTYPGNHLVSREGA